MRISIFDYHIVVINNFMDLFISNFKFKNILILYTQFSMKINK